jgi:hypothetical protein
VELRGHWRHFERGYIIAAECYNFEFPWTAQS